MELKDFIKHSLVQITKGIQEVNEELEDTDVKINPKNVYVNAKARQDYGRLMENKETVPVVELVEYDVAVFAEEGTETKGGIGTSVGSIGRYWCSRKI